MIVDLDNILLEREHFVRSGLGPRAWFRPPAVRMRPRPPSLTLPSKGGGNGLAPCIDVQPSRDPERWLLPPKPARTWAARAKWDGLAKGLPKLLTAPGRRALVRVLWTHDVRFGDLTGPEKCWRFVDARRAAVLAVSAAQPKLSTPQLGRIFARHHTTILMHLGRLPGKGRV